MDSSEVPDKISVMGACTIYITGEGDVAPDINIETVNGGNVVNEYENGSIIPPPGSFIEGMGISDVVVDVDSGTVDQAPGPWASVDLTEGTMSIAFHNICGAGNGSSTVDYSIDLTNDNDSLCYDPDSGRCVEDPISTTVTLYYQGIPVEGAIYSITDRVGMTNDQATISGNVVTVSGLNNSGYVIIRGAIDDIELFIKFNIKKVWGYTKYYLEIDPNTITYNKSTHEMSSDQIIVKVNKSGQNDSGSIEYVHMQSLAGNGVRLYVDGVNKTADYVSGSYTQSISVPADNKNYYYIKITNDSGDFLDGEYININKVSNGADSTVPGPPGTSVKDVKQYFKLSNNTSESYPSSTYGNPPNTSSGWYPTSDGMTVSNNNKYIWSFWRTTYEDNTWEDTGLAKVVWYDPVMTNIKQYFKLSNNTSESYPGGGDPPAGWSSSSDGLNVDSTHRYLWTFFRSWYDNGTYDDSGMARITWYDPIMTGMNQYFKLSSSESMAYPSDGTFTTPPSGWSTSSVGMSCSAQNKYLWTFFRTFYDNNTHDDSGMAKIAMYQQYVNGVIQYYKKSANAAGETSPASSSGNPPDSASGWTANGNSIVLDSASPYLWSFFRTNYEGGTWEDSVPSVIRYFNAQAQIDYNEVTSKVEENIGYDLDNLKLMFSGSSPRQTFADSVISLESASISTSVASAVSGTMSAVNQKIDGLSGSVSTSMVQLNALSGTIGSVSDVANAADGKATRAVWNGKYIWYKNTGSGTSATTVYKNYECPVTSSQTQYENYMKSSAGGSWLGPSMSADAMSVLQQESDKIFMGVGDGTNVAASITLLKGCSTSDSKIVLDAAHVIINGGLAANVVTASNIAAGAIQSTQISSSVIEGKHIKAETISGSLITGGTISSSLLSAGAVTAGKVAANAISASNIVAGTITGDRIVGGTISSSLLSAEAVTAGKVAADAISGSNIIAGSINADRIKAGTITGTQISSSAITGGLIAADAISGSNIVAGSINSNHIQANSIHSTHITASAITANKLAADAIEALSLSASSAVVSDLNAGTITVTVLRSNPSLIKSQSAAVSGAKMTYVEKARINVEEGNYSIFASQDMYSSSSAEGESLISSSDKLLAYFGTIQVSGSTYAQLKILGPNGWTYLDYDGIRKPDIADAVIHPETWYGEKGLKATDTLLQYINAGSPSGTTGYFLMGDFYDRWKWTQGSASSAATGSTWKWASMGSSTYNLTTSSSYNNHWFKYQGSTNYMIADGTSEWYSTLLHTYPETSVTVSGSYTGPGVAILFRKWTNGVVAPTPAFNNKSDTVVVCAYYEPYAGAGPQYSSGLTWNSRMICTAIYSFSESQAHGITPQQN